MTTDDIYSVALAAETRIRPYVLETPLRRSEHLSDKYKADVHLKLENLQLTGSFKVRGAFNKLLSLGEDERSRGVVVASTGNHGLAMAYAMKTLGVQGIVFVPVGAAKTKVENIRRCGAEVRFFGDEGGATERFARSFAAERGMVYVSPYNDWEVVAGQATVGVEIGRQLQDVDAVVASLGGGGLIGGVAGYLKASRGRDVQVLAISPRNSKSMMESVKIGHVVDTEHLPTLSDATAGGIDHDTITFDLCRSTVDRFIDLDEEAIADGMRDVIANEHMLVEGSAALAVAGLAALDGLEGRKIVVVLCGANIDPAKLKEAL